MGDITVVEILWTSRRNSCIYIYRVAATGDTQMKMDTPKTSERLIIVEV